MKNDVLNVVGVKPESWLEDIKELHSGEIEFLELARESGEMLGIKAHDHFIWYFLMLRKGKIDKKVAKGNVDVTIRKGFRLSAEVNSEFLF